MSCEPIVDLTLNQASLDAIERIKKKNNLAKLLTASITVGVFNSIFTKSQAPVAACNIAQTDWSLYAQAVSGLPELQKNVIMKEIDYMVLHCQFNGYDHKHVKFWKGLQDACQ